MERRLRRYEIIDTETGEKVASPSFILTPTGEEMHLLSDKVAYIGPLKDIGIYYHGETHDGLTGNDSLPSLTPIALEYVVKKIFTQLATGLHPARQRRGIEALNRLGVMALKLYDEHVNEEEESFA